MDDSKLLQESTLTTRQRYSAPDHVIQTTTSEGLAKVSMWRLEWDSNLRPCGRKTPNLPLSHHAIVITSLLAAIGKQHIKTKQHDVMEITDVSLTLTFKYQHSLRFVRSATKPTNCLRVDSLGGALYKKAAIIH